MAGRRLKVGRRRDTALFEVHNGNVDDYGTPTLTVDADWNRFVTWPCEFLGSNGGEFLRGRQVTAQASNTLYGDFSAVRNVTTEMRLKIRGLVYGILDVTDAQGDMREMVIDVKRET